MTKIYLDDCRTPADPSWIVVRSYDEFVDWITKNGMPDFISFDYDLLEGEKTGFDCADWVMSNDLELPAYSVHSGNKEGGDLIISILDSWQIFTGNEVGYKTFWELKIDGDEIQ